MRFTGLQDKDGIDIYEGDIVLITLEDGQEKRKVAWDHTFGRWEPYLKGINEYWYTMHNLVNTEGATVEIIGNIHQNPELIQP